MSTKRKMRKQTEAEIRRLTDDMRHIRQDLELAYTRFDELHDPMQMDACIYEINALRAKYNCAVHNLRSIPRS